jgi:GTPase
MPEKTIVVGLIQPQVSKTVAEEHLEELEKLVESAGGIVVERVFGKRNGPDPATYIGRGKAEEIGELAAQHDVKLVVFDDDLSPAQARNLEGIIPAKVIDRSGLILDIFAGRARSREARTQVELAQLNYLLSRLTRAWSHLSRQAGGIGTRGVGETQLESDRRIIRARIGRLKEELAKIERTRETQRKSRNAAFTVALVGYTNAGKSTLFNHLTHGHSVAVAKLFATLDAKSQRTHFEMPRETVIIDTVGFIRKLPHHLVASFRSTMEEAVAADLVLHLIDASHPQFEDQRAVGEEVLRDLGVEPDRVIEVFNKVDRFRDEEDLSRPARRRRNTISLSGLTGYNADHLLKMIREREMEGGEILHLRIPHEQSRALAELHELGVILARKNADQWVELKVWVPHQSVRRFDEFATTADNLLQAASIV